jgi:hypothetical protein
VEIVQRFGLVEKLHLVNEHCIANPDAKFDFSKWEMMLKSGDPGELGRRAVEGALSSEFYHV